MTWSENRLIQSGPSAYSDLYELPDGGRGIVLQTGEAQASKRLDDVRVGPAWWNR